MNTNDRINALVVDNARLKEQLSVAENERDEALAILAELDLLVSDSAGVSGYHMNGDVAKWDEFSELFDGAQALQELKRREQVKGILCVLDECDQWSMMDTYGVTVDDIFELANKIQSGEVTA